MSSFRLSLLISSKLRNDPTAPSKNPTRVGIFLSLSHVFLIHFIASKNKYVIPILLSYVDYDVIHRIIIAFRRHQHPTSFL